MENRYAQYWVDDGILFFVYKPNISINLKSAQKIVQDRINFQGDISYPILCNLRLLKIADKPARDFLAQQGSIMAKAVALLVDDDYSRFFGDFFLSGSVPTVPTKIFTNQIKALEFLRTFK